MFSSVRGTIWDRIRIKNAEMNREQTAGDGGGAVSEWDLSQVDLHREEDGSRKIPTIELDDEDEEDNIESASVRGEEPLRGFPSAHRVHVVPVQVESTPVMVGDAHSRSLVRRSIHEYRRGDALEDSLPGEAFQLHGRPATAGIIVNRSYNKKPSNPPPRENYFSSVLDTPPSPGMLPVASIFGESRPTSTEPRIVMTANHYEKRIIRRSVEKPSSTTTGTTTSSSDRSRRREKNNGPYRLLGVIDLEPDSETESTSSYPGVLNNTASPTTTAMESFVSRKNLCSPAGAAGVTTSRSAQVTSSSDVVGEKVLTIEIDEDEGAFDEEDTRMELSEGEYEMEEPIPAMEEDEQQVAGSSGVGKKDDDDVDEEGGTLSDSDSSTAQVNPSSLANSFWDVSSSGCNKQTCGEKSGSSKKTNNETEFDLLLDKINQQVPAMSQEDRIEHWRVTKEDLLYSIPTVAEIESGKPVKRPMDGPIHISSSESSSDSETSASPSLLAAKQQANYKKRRTGEELATGDRSSPSLHLSEELDFRRSQINPEIDKSMIQLRKNYHKFPTRFIPSTNDDHNHRPQDPYVKLLNRADAESDKFGTVLRRNNPAYRPDLKALQQCQPQDNKVAVVVLSPLSLQTSATLTAPETSIRPEPTPEPEVSRYGKERTAVGRKLRYKVRKPRNKLTKKQSIAVIAANLRSSYRRLIMKQSSLRNGKVRKKASFVNLLTATKKKRSRPTVIKPPPVVEEPKIEVIVARTRARESVDSAVSSSTSAEHKKTVEPVPVPCNELRTMKNPLNRADGEVLAVYYHVDKLIVVQQEMVSFWGCSKLAALLGLSQELSRLGQCRRAQVDSPVDSSNSQRLGFNENEPFYLEPRARNLDEDAARACPLASLYVNCYYLAEKDDDADDNQAGDGASNDNNDETESSQSVLRMKSLQLDSVRSEISDILFMPLPNSRYFILCWHEQLSESDFRTGLCKYSLTPDLETLASIREFPSVTQKITALRCTDDKLIGLGATTIAIWNTVNGFLVFTVDLKVDIQVPLATYVHTENDESALFLVQLCPSPSGNDKRKLIKVLGINMGKRSWHLVHSYEVALESQSILCSSSTLTAASSLHCASFRSGELLALSLDDLTTCITNHERLQGPDGRRVTRDIVATREKIFLHPAEPRQLVLVSDKFIKLKTVDEYLLACR